MPTFEDDDEEQDDDDDDDDWLKARREDCGAEHRCLGESMTTTGSCIKPSGHPGPHLCFLCNCQF